MRRVIHADNLEALADVRDESASLVYIDPPFNTGRTQSRTTTRTVRDEAAGDRTGFQGKRYRTIKLGSSGYSDTFDDYLGFLEPRFREAWRVLKPNILWYAKDPQDYTFRYDDIDRIPYMAPGLVGPEKAARGKTPTDVWWHTIVSPNGKEKTGYATQKPLGIIERIVRVHTHPGDLVIDFFAGSGTVGEAAARLGRDFILIDHNPEAIRAMAKRLAPYGVVFESCDGTSGAEDATACP